MISLYYCPKHDELVLAWPRSISCGYGLMVTAFEHYYWSRYNKGPVLLGMDPDYYNYVYIGAFSENIEFVLENEIEINAYI